MQLSCETNVLYDFCRKPGGSSEALCEVADIFAMFFQKHFTSKRRSVVFISEFQRDRLSLLQQHSLRIFHIGIRELSTVALQGGNSFVNIRLQARNVEELLDKVVRDFGEVLLLGSFTDILRCPLSLSNGFGAIFCFEPLWDEGRMHPKYVFAALLAGDVISDVSHRLVVPRIPTEAVVPTIGGGDYESVTWSHVIWTYEATFLQPTPEHSITGIPCLPFILCCGSALYVWDIVT